MRLRLTLVVAIAAIVAEVAHAEPVGSHLEFTPLAGWALMDGQQRSNGVPVANDLYFGGRLGYQLRPWVAVEAAAGITPTQEDVSNGGEVTFSHASGNVVFTPWAGRWGGPFLSAGGGTSRFSPSRGGSAVSQGAFEAAGGLRFWMTDALGLRLEMRQLAYSTDPGSPKINDMIVAGGVLLALGATPRDTDGDGVPDRKDACPDTPRGATVDAKGCPKDSDGDGVLDGIDQCPGTAKGCAVDEKGCPKDSDGDGVCDGVDQCPETGPGLKVDAQGCPIEVMEKETELLDTGMIRLQDVNFETDKSALLAESLPLLDVVGAVLSKWPELKIEIGGHTDARGSNAHNQKLSEGRAEAVRTYLVGKFPQLKAEQYTVKGYGESRPLVPNTSALNMAKNRRVEFVVKNPSVLKHEVERRQLLKKEAPAPRPAPSDTLRMPAPSDTLKTTPAPPDTSQ